MADLLSAPAMENSDEQRNVDEARAYHASLLDNVEDGVIGTDADDFRVTSWNKAAERLYGFTAREMMGQPARDAASYPGDESRLKLDTELQQTGRTRIEFTARRKDGTSVEVELITVAVPGKQGELSGYLGIHHDITERKRIEGALRQANARIVTLLEGTTDEFVAFDQGWGYADANEGGLKAINNALGTSLTHADLIGTTVWDLFPEFGQTALYAELSRGRAEGRPVRLETYSEPGGRWLEVSSFPWNGGMAVYTRDISDRRAAEQLQTLHASLLDNVEDGVIGTDAENCRITSWNKGAERLYGFTAQEVLGRPAREIASYPGDSSRVELEGQLLQTGRTRTQFTARRKDGAQVEVELIAVAVHDDGGDITGYLGIHRDVTARERAEARLEEAREVERSRIARALHDDALQALADAMVLATAARGAKPSGLTSQLVLKLQRIGRQLRGAIYDLRLPAEHKALPLVLEELVAVHREMGGVEIGLQIAQSTPTGPFGTDSIELVRIVGEALTNARRHADARHVVVRVAAEEGKLWAEISDDGLGFDPRSVAPGVHHGITGMRERAELLGGRLEVRSQPGSGTTVRFEADVSDGDIGRV
jgi:PAS domain S-box-containing protein